MATTKYYGDEKDRKSLAFRLRDSLFKYGFEPHSFHREFNAGECVYLKPLNDNMYVVVFTTIEYHKIRAKAEDAIRVIGIYESKSGAQRALVKTERVHRTGSIHGIIGRVMERIRIVEEAIRQPNPCKSCGAPLFLSKKGNSVCAELCWKK